MLSAESSEERQGGNGFAQLPPASLISELRGLDSLKLTKYYPRGTVLFAEGQRPGGIYVLREGNAKISIASAEGKTLVLRIVPAGEPLGMNETLTGQPYMATVVTLERCRIDFVSRENLLDLLDQDKRSYLGVAQCLGRELTSLVDHNRLLFLSQSAPEKLARLLIKWSNDLGQPTTGGILIKHGLTHEEIAQIISTSRETVTRLLSTLKRKHILEAKNGHLVIRNQVGLYALTRQN